MQEPDFSHSRHGAYGDHLKAVRASNCPSSVLQQMADLHGRTSTSLLVRVAAHPQCPPLLLHKLSQDTKVLVRQAVASNVGCPPDVLQKLAGDPDWAVNNVALANPALSTSILEDLAAKPSLWYRMLYNPNCPTKVMRGMCTPRTPDAHHTVAKHHRCPPDVLEQLAVHHNWIVRCAVAGNPGCPISLLLRLKNDLNHSVAQRAAEHPLLTEEYLALYQISQ